MATSLSVKGCKPGRTPQETSEELLLVGGERRLHGLLHCGDSTSNRASVNCVRRAPTLVRHELMRDVQRRHDRDALVARDLARIAHFLELAVEVVGRGEQLLFLPVGAGDAELAAEQADREGALFARAIVGAHVSVSGIWRSSASMRDFAAPSFSPRRAFSSVRAATCWGRSRVDQGLSR